MRFVDEIKQKFATTVHVRCESLVDEKIARLVSGGPDRLQVISDFDRTISRSEYNNQPTMSSFCVFELCESLSDEYRGKAAALLQKYRPIEDDTQMTVAEKLPYIEQWWRQSEQLLKGLRFQYEDIEKSIKKADVKLREGYAEAFGKLCGQKIPLIVLSAGIGDVVELTLKHENLWTDNVSVVSNFLKLSADNDGKRTVEGFQGDKLIHVFNKNEHAYTDTHKNVFKETHRRRVRRIMQFLFLSVCPPQGHASERKDQRHSHGRLAGRREHGRRHRVRHGAAHRVSEQRSDGTRVRIPATVRTGVRRRPGAGPDHGVAELFVGQNNNGTGGPRRLRQ